MIFIVGNKQEVEKKYSERTSLNEKKSSDRNTGFFKN